MLNQPRYDLVNFKGFLFLYRTLGGKCTTINWLAYNADDKKKLEIKADYAELIFLQSVLIGGSADIHSDIDLEAIHTRIFQIEHKYD